jgi:hypothetical protein
MATKRHDFVQEDSLADYICDYLDNEMDVVVAEVFEEYIASVPKLAQFVRDANQGKKALEHLRNFNIEADDLSLPSI